MKTFFVLSAIAALAFAQTAFIPVPTDGASVTRGQTFVVELDKRNSHSPSVDVSVVIGLDTCGDVGCEEISESQTMGELLWKGNYEPIPRDGSGTRFQNWTVQVPSSMSPGPTVLKVAHFYLGGIAESPTVEIITTGVNVL